MGTYSYSGAVQKVTVGATGTYQITAYGGQGGSASGASGGQGAEVAGLFHLTAGEKLEIVVGGAGASTGSLYGGGGGGGTFVLANIGAGGAYVPLEVAGGGGGAFLNSAGGAGSATATGDGQGGTSGFGGGGGGAGVKSNGGTGSSGTFKSAKGGSNGSGGYSGGASNSFNAKGGFGGGGAGSRGTYRAAYQSYPQSDGGGGGGGYSGGNGGGGQYLGPNQPGSGGTSFVSTTGAEPIAISGENSGNGKVVIGPASMPANQNVSSGDQLYAAIFAINGGNGSYTINVTGNLSLTRSLIPIQLGAGGSLTINGNGFSVDGGGTSGGFIVAPTSAASGTNTIAINNFAINNTIQTGGAGANAGGPGGGGAGLGGALFVGAGANVTLTNVAFDGDKAIGGVGGNANGTNYGSGGSLDGTTLAGDQGGAPNNSSYPYAGGSGGFGGGGAGGFESAGGSEFGGGAGVTGVGTSTSGGFGGGSSPAIAYPATQAGGGGGLGAGGAVFVQAGGSLTIAGGDPATGATISGGSVVGGAGGTGGATGGAGAALGSGIFLQGNQPVTLAPAAGQTETVSDVVADQPGSAGLIVNGAGTVKLTAQNTYAGGTMIQSGTLDLGAPDMGPAGSVVSGAAGTGAITFAGAAASPVTLALESAAEPTSGGTFGNTLADFGTDDTLDLEGLTFQQGATATVANGVLTVSSGGVSENFTLSNPGATMFYAYQDGENGTLVNDDPACYGTGTLIRTVRGDVAVEALAIGDVVVTASGAERPIKWIGRRTYSARFARNNPDLLPVCVKANALADGLPLRDLWVSPKHAMYIDGVLIPAEHLVNGASVVKAERADDGLAYWHVELDQHDLLIAEGAASESFVDDDSRGMFQNAHTFAQMYPGVTRGAATYCAPRVEHGYTLQRVRRRLAERAGLPVPKDRAFGRLRGNVDTCDGVVIEGWAQDDLYPDAPVCLDVIVDGTIVARAYAELYRRDLAHAGIGNGCHGFCLKLPAPLSADLTHVVEVRRSADGAALAGTQRMAAVAAAA